MIGVTKICNPNAATCAGFRYAAHLGDDAR
jgi:hypothetical protein